MVDLAMLADIQRTVYPEEVTRQLPVMAQARESLQTDVLTTVLRNQPSRVSRLTCRSVEGVSVVSKQD